MQIINTAKGPRGCAIRKGAKVAKLNFLPGVVSTVPDDLWAEAKKRTGIAAMLAAGQLQEIGASAANAAAAAGAGAADAVKVVSDATKGPTAAEKKAAEKAAKEAEKKA